jgi:hypothetical protein
MTALILISRRVRRKCRDEARARFLSAVVATPERGKTPSFRHAACHGSSHNLSHLTPFQMRPVSWSNAYASRCPAARRMREKPSTLRSGFDATAVPKRPGQPPRSRRAGDFSGPRGPAGALVEELRRRARAASPDRDNVGNRRTRARASDRARRARPSEAARRVSALRLVRADAERTVSAVREGARCR